MNIKSIILAVFVLGFVTEPPYINATTVKHECFRCYSDKSDCYSWLKKEHIECYKQWLQTCDITALEHEFKNLFKLYHQQINMICKYDRDRLEEFYSSFGYGYEYLRSLNIDTYEPFFENIVTCDEGTISYIIHVPSGSQKNSFFPVRYTPKDDSPSLDIIAEIHLNRLLELGEVYINKTKAGISNSYTRAFTAAQKIKKLYENFLNAKD